MPIEQLMPGAEPFHHEGVPGAPVVLFCHGFTGTPQPLRPWARELAEHGYTVDLPLLPGHGRTWQLMNRTGWQDWFACVERRLLDLAGPGQPVFVGGLSMGGALALRLAITHPDLVAGLMLVNPAVAADDPRLRFLPVLRRLTASVPGIGSDIAKPGNTELAYSRTPLHALTSNLELFADVASNLPRVRCPVLLFRSRTDHVVPRRSPVMVRDLVSSKDLTDVVLERSYHVATLDYDADVIQRDSVAFIERISGGRA